MNLIDRYVAEVGKHLPRRNRADIEAEIRSTLEDMLDERKQAEGPASEAEIIALLKEYGSPFEVAAKYGMHSQYLIGPRMYPIFLRVVKILFAIVIGASTLAFAVNLVQVDLTGPAFMSAMGDWFGGLVSGLIAAFGNIVLVFAIIERTSMMGEVEKEFKEWDPKQLKETPDPDKIDLPDHIFTIIFTFLGLAVFNLYPDLISVRFVNDETWTTMPVLTSVFFSFLPWINVMGLLQVGFNSYMISQKDWMPVTRILDMVVDVAGMILGVIILRTPGIFNIDAEMFRAAGLSDVADVFSKMFDIIPTIVIIIIVVATTIKVVKTLLKLFNVKTKPPYPVAK